MSSVLYLFVFEYGDLFTNINSLIKVRYRTLKKKMGKNRIKKIILKPKLFKKMLLVIILYMYKIT